MKWSRIAPRCVTAAMTAMTAMAVWPASPRVVAQDVQGAATPDQAAVGDGLHLRYATARLDLARLDLEKARRQNADAGSPQVPAADMRRLEVRVEALERVVESEKTQRVNGQLDGQVARARAALELVREDLARLERLHAAVPATVPEIDLRRQRTRVEIAELRLALWQDPNHVPSAIDRMQIQIDQLTDQIVDLIDQIENRRLVTPPP